MKLVFFVVVFFLCAPAIAGPAPAGSTPSDGGATDASGPPGVRGSLHKEDIRRVMRRHFDEVKDCYEPELKKTPTLAGTVMVQFTIAGSGAVIASTLQSSTMGNARVENCTVQAVRRWQFPEPMGGGMVIVSYPFLLTPGRLTLIAGKKGAGALQIEWLNDHILVHVSSDPHAVSSNGLIAITARGLMLFDTAWTDEQTDAILRFGREELKLPWIGAVITHDHPDRAGGIGAVMRAGVPVAALDLTVAKLAKRGVRGVKSLFTAANGQYVDDRGFEAFYPGPGHTSDNIVISFPLSTVVFGGCLVKSADAADLGFTGDADRAAWPGAVRRVELRYPEPQYLVPGHGAVDRDVAAYRHTLDLLAR